MNERAVGGDDASSSVDLFESARVAARLSRRTISVELESIAGLPPYSALKLVGERLGMPVLSLSELEDLTPEFDRLPLAKAMQRCALLVRDSAGNTSAVVKDPQDVDLQTWLQAQCGGLISSDRSIGGQSGIDEEKR